MSKPTESDIQQPTQNVPSLDASIVWNKDCRCGDGLAQHAEDGICLFCERKQFVVRGWVAV